MQSNPVIVPIVEGRGDRDSVPVLLRKILQERHERYDVQVSKPKSANGKPNLIKKLESFLRYALISEGGCHGIIVILDADKDCPRKLAQLISSRASKLGLNVPVVVVCANHEYETWIISSLGRDRGQEIRERLGLPSSVNCPDEVENLSGAKAWLTDRMPSERAYKETSDQISLTFHIDLELTLSRSRSFRRLCHAVEELVNAMDNSLNSVTPSHDL